MARKSKEYLEKLKQKHNVDKLWSWSRYHVYKSDPYSYLLRYILGERETRSSIYGVSGNNCHDIVEKFYMNELKYEDMAKEYELKLYEMNLAGLKYNRKDEDKNNKIADDYENNIRLFFREHIPIESKVICEQFVTIKVGDNLFQGYVDFIHRDRDGKYVITDWKTSTIYQGKKIEEERGQLVLYAESLIQRGIPIENIKIQWNFLKYCTVEYEMFTKDKETGEFKIKQLNTLRTEKIPKSIENNIRSRLKKLDYNELQIEDIVQTAIENNSFDTLPDEIKGKYKWYDCYVEIPLTQAIVDNLKEDIINTIEEIKIKEKEYAQTEDDTVFWTEIDARNQYFFANICGFSPKQHKPYQEYLDSLKLFEMDGETKRLKTGSNTDDLSWLDDL